MPRTINVKIYKNDQQLGSKLFSQEVIKIGKLRSSDLLLEDDAVARMHAVIEVTASDLRVVDLGSAAGTSVNGQRVDKSARLHGGESLSFGPYRLEVETMPASVASAAAPGPAAPGPAAVASAAAPGYAAMQAPALAVTPAVAPAPTTTSAPMRTPMALRSMSAEAGDGRNVAEVVAAYGGTVLDVQHVGQVRSRRRQAPAWLALGGLMILGGVGIVASDVSQDWEAYQTARADAQAAGRAAPEAPGHGLGGLGIALALLGLVPFGVGVVRRDDVGVDRYTLGEGHDASFHVSAEGLAGDEAFPLVRQHGEDYVLHFTPQMRGEVVLDGQSLGLDELVGSGRAGATGSSYAFPLPAGSRCRVEHAGVTYRVASVPRGKAIAGKSEADKPFWIYNAASFAVMGGLLAMVHLIPEEAMAMNLDDLSAENRFVGYIAQPEEQPEEIVEVTEERSDEESGGEGTRHAGAEGKMGDPKTNKQSGLYKMKGPRDAVPTMARDFDPEMLARQSGILGLMQRESSHFLASPYGSIASGNDDEDIWGGLTGTEHAAAFGVGGLGLVGTGRGGGGTGQGTIGLGNVGTIGKGGGGGKGTGYGRGSGSGFGPKGRRVPKIRRGKAKITGQIDKDIIRRIVRNHINEVRSCYNAGLSKDPNLRGRVAVMFTIGPSGKVVRSAIAESSVGDRNVANCVSNAVRRWKFPKPQSGGSAMVTYPFTFAPG